MLSHVEGKNGGGSSAPGIWLRTRLFGLCAPQITVLVGYQVDFGIAAALVPVMTQLGFRGDEWYGESLPMLTKRRRTRLPRRAMR